MKPTTIPPIKSDGLEVSTHWDGAVLRIEFDGTAGMRAMAPLATLTSNVHLEARKAHSQEVVIDFRKLEFMNSSCFKVLVTWLRQVSELEPSEQYRIRFVANAARLWQERSLAALKAFAADHVTIERA
jgi:hypothetical protein